jgi:hypothetical protein
MRIRIEDPKIMCDYCSAVYYINTFFFTDIFFQGNWSTSGRTTTPHPATTSQASVAFAAAAAVTKVPGQYLQ